MEVSTIDLKLNTSSKENFRSGITDFELLVKDIKGVVIGDSDICPLKHTFSDGIYVREIFIPKGMLIVGKIHKHDHPNFLMEGRVKVVTEAGEEYVNAPCSMISPAGTKRALYAETDLVWITVHNNPTNTRDMSILEKEIIAEDFTVYDKYIESKKSITHKLKSFIIKKLTQ